MPQPLHGFHIRAPRPAEAAVLSQWFDPALLGRHERSFLGAFAQPGDVPLGAVMVRPADGGRLGRFAIHVPAPYRRHHIGTVLMHRLYALALANNAQRLVLSGLVHQDRPENAFYQFVGLAPERSFATYTLSARAVAACLDPLAVRCATSHPHLADTRIVPLCQWEPAAIARFFARHYGMYEDAQLANLTQGRYDMKLSSVLLRNEEILAVALVRSRPDQPAVMIELIVAAPHVRHGPAAIALCAHLSHAAIEYGFTHGVYEADERFDRFATTLARRCNAAPQWRRHRYAISRADMQKQLAHPPTGLQASPPTPEP